MSTRVTAVHEGWIDEVSALLVASSAPGANPNVDKFSNHIAHSFGVSLWIVAYAGISADSFLKPVLKQLARSAIADDIEGALRNVRPPPDCNCPGLQPPDADAVRVASGTASASIAADASAAPAARRGLPAARGQQSKQRASGKSQHAAPQAAAQASPQAQRAPQSSTQQQHQGLAGTKMAAGSVGAQCAAPEPGGCSGAQAAQPLSKSQKKKQKQRRKAAREAEAGGKENLVA